MLLVVSNELGGLEGDLLEDVTNEGVHDVHRSLGDASLGVDLLEHSVDVDGECFGSLLLAVSTSLSLGVLGTASLGDFGSGSSLC